MGVAPVALTFLYGPLTDPALCEAVLGPGVAGRAACLPGQALVGEGLFPAMIPDPDGRVEGQLVPLTEEEEARLAFYLSPQQASVVTVLAGGAALAARLHRPDVQGAAGGPWTLAGWQARYGMVAPGAARDRLRGFATGGLRPHSMLLTREGSRLRAAGGPRRLRPAAPDGAVAVAAVREPYVRFFAVEEYDLSFSRFDGGMSDTVTRAVFVSGDAATVLPYDPVRDRVLVIEQFRTGPFARGDVQPWIYEPVAGRIDAGETPEDAARRETQEEAGLAIRDLIRVGSYYSTPGIASEYLYSFVAVVDLPDSAARIAGLEAEAEDIRGRLLSFDELLDHVRSGEGTNGPLLVTALWLALNRDGLRAGAGVA